MEKEFGRITKSENTDIIVRVDDFKGEVGITIREFMKSDRYTGFTKSGTRIPADRWQEFLDVVNRVEIPEKSEMNEEEKITEE